MPAETLPCPACGASASTDATQCSSCGAALARADRTQVPASEQQLCPRCQVDMNAVVVGSTHLRECPRCEGVWADAIALQQICTEREQQAAVLGMAAPPAETLRRETPVRYVPCPVCHKLMNRVNFAHCSGVIIAVCKAHGTWFDTDELRRIVEFISSGGLEKARARETAVAEEQQRQLRAQPTANVGIYGPDAQAATYGSFHHTGVFAIADIAAWLLSLFTE